MKREVRNAAEMVRPARKEHMSRDDRGKAWEKRTFPLTTHGDERPGLAHTVLPAGGKGKRGREESRKLRNQGGWGGGDRGIKSSLVEMVTEKQGTEGQPRPRCHPNV